MSETAIIGGGITGLTTAYYLEEFSRGELTCKLFESSSRVGGKIVTDRDKNFLIEGGPDSFLAQSPSTQDLCTALGLSTELIGSKATEGPATYVFSGGHMHPMPEGMMLMAPTMILPILRSRLITPRGKLRMALDLVIPPRGDRTDESLASFVRRRLGPEVLDKIAAPLMAGIHAADPERLSLRSTFPTFVEMEEKHGSLVVGMMRRKKAQPAPSSALNSSTSKRPPMFLTLAGGIQQLTDAIAAQLQPWQIKLNARVRAVVRHHGRYRIELVDGSFTQADNVVFATPAGVTANLIQQIDPALAKSLRAIRYVSTATVSLAFRRSDLHCELKGLGFIVPAGEKRRINACSWSSAKFPHRAPDDCVLMRVFVGGALAEHLAEQNESDLIDLAREELRNILGITATPVTARAYRWDKAIPQYEIGHQALVAKIQKLAAANSGLYLTGAAYQGAGIPACVLQGRETALTIVKSAAGARKLPEETLVPASTCI